MRGVSCRRGNWCSWSWLFGAGSCILFWCSRTWRSCRIWGRWSGWKAPGLRTGRPAIWRSSVVRFRSSCGLGCLSCSPLWWGRFAPAMSGWISGRILSCLQSRSRNASSTLWCSFFTKLPAPPTSQYCPSSKTCTSAAHTTTKNKKILCTVGTYRMETPATIALAGPLPGPPFITLQNTQNSRLPSPLPLSRSG